MRAGVARSMDGGATWTTLATNPSGDLLAIDPSRPSTLYATGTGQGGRPLLFKSVDRGAHWAAVTESLRFESGFLALAVDPARPSRLFLGSVENGLWRSLDGGASWRQPVQGIPGGFRASISALAAALKPFSGTVYAGVAGRGLFRSANSGDSWKRVRGLPPARVWATAIAPSDPRTIYASFAGQGLFRSADADASWRVVPRPLGGAVLALVVHSITAIAVSPVPGRVYAATPDGRVFRSEDGGATWSDWSAGLKVRAIEEIVVDPDAPGRVYLASSNGIWVLEEE